MVYKIQPRTSRFLQERHMAVGTIYWKNTKKNTQCHMQGGKRKSQDR